MHTTGKKITLITWWMLSMIAFSAPSFGEHDHEGDHPDEKEHHAQEEHDRGPGPLIEEMVPA